MSTIPSLLFIGKFLSNIIGKSVYGKIAYASFCMYLFHRVIFYLMMNSYSPGSNFHTVIYLTLAGVPIIFAISFYAQKYYDRLISYGDEKLKVYCKFLNPKSKTPLLCRLGMKRGNAAL
jgi:peptidoglycan/LPS O-acetylase OafA/YrhL